MRNLISIFILLILTCNSCINFYAKKSPIPPDKEAISNEIQVDRHKDKQVRSNYRIIYNDGTKKTKTGELIRVEQDTLIISNHDFLNPEKAIPLKSIDNIQYKHLKGLSVFLNIYLIAGIIVLPIFIADPSGFLWGK